MRNLYSILKLALIFIIFISLAAPAFSETTTNTNDANTNDNLNKSINDKSKQLELINDQIKQTNDNLTQLSGQKRTLSSELKKIDYTLNQVSLSIRSSELSISKLNLEIQQLNQRSSDVEQSIDNKRIAIRDAIYLLNKEDHGNLITTLLKSKSLVAGAFEAQALASIQDKLITNVQELTELNQSLNETIEQQEEKRDQIERESGTLKIRQNLVASEKKERSDLLSQTKNKEQLYQSQLSDLQKQQAEVSNEIEKLEFVLRGEIDATKIPTAQPGLLTFPVPGGRITQLHGKTSFAKVTYGSQRHNGYDFGKFLGAEIVAAADGIVVAVGNQDLYCRGAAYGKFVVVKHYNGLTTLYAHLSAYKVKIGQQVKRAEVIAYMGRTGWATGPHLHFTIFDSSTYKLSPSRTCGPMPIGGDIDPGNYLSIR